MPENRKIQQVQLSSGARLLTRRTPGLPFVNIRLHLDGAGSGYEIFGDFPRGTAHFLEHICCTHTAHYKPQEAQILLGNIMGSGGAVTSEEFMYFYASGKRSEFETVAHIVADRVCRPVFDTPALETERKRILAERMMGQMNKPNDFAFNEANYLATGKHPFFFLPIGTIEDIKAITPEHLEAFHRQKFCCEKATIVVEGDVNHQKTAAFFERNLSLPRTAAKDSPDVRFVSNDLRRHEEVEGVRLFVLFPTLPKGEENAVEFDKFFCGVMAKEVGSLLIGKGQAYHTEMRLGGYSELFTRAIGSTVLPEEAGGWLESVGAALASLSKDGGGKSFETVRKKILHDQKLTKNVRQRGTNILMGEMLRYGQPREFEEVLAFLEKVSQEDIQAAVKKILDGPCFFFAKGNVAHVPERGEVARLLGMKELAKAAIATPL